MLILSVEYLSCEIEQNAYLYWQTHTVMWYVFERKHPHPFPDDYIKASSDADGVWYRDVMRGKKGAV